MKMYIVYDMCIVMLIYIYYTYMHSYSFMFVFFCSLHAHDFKSEMLWVYFCRFKRAPVLIFTLPIANRTGHLVGKMPIPAMLLAFPRLCLNAPPSVERHPLMQQKPERRAVSGKSFWRFGASLMFPQWFLIIGHTVFLILTRKLTWKPKMEVWKMFFLF